MIIIGAGLAGLIAAHAWPRANVIERGPQPLQQHQALLRFRGEAVSRLTGIEFRKVMVRKGVWNSDIGGYVQPDIRAANLYAQKCLGELHGERSIWRLDPVERWIAPPEFYGMLLENLGSRVSWDVTFDSTLAGATQRPIISTAPLGEMCSVFGIIDLTTHTADRERVLPLFKRAAIHVSRYIVPGADVFQTAYFPTEEHGVYRASITGDVLIVESMDGGLTDFELGDVARAFGITSSTLITLGSTKQSYGKIAPIDDNVRKQLLFRLTHDHGVYSLGRFATWRNILLDDVVDDIGSIKRLMRSNSPYEFSKAMS